MTIIYREEDGRIEDLMGKTIGILGYGNLGRPIALNLRDSGLNVQVGIRSNEGYRQAVEDQIRASALEQIVQSSDIILLMLPDEVMPQVYLETVSPYMTKGKTLIFASGYNITFGFIEPPPFIDVGLIAPRTFGTTVRDRYLSGEGFYSFVAVGQDASGTIWDTVLGLAGAMGSLHAGAIEVTMEQEVELDLFLQQAVLPAVQHILTTAARLLLASGYPPEAAMMDLYISGELNDYVTRAADEGLLHALRHSTLTGQYGIFSRLERFNELKLERLMEVTLDEIRGADFAKEWAREYADGYPRLRKLRQAQERQDLWELELQTIEMLRDL